MNRQTITGLALLGGLILTLGACEQRAEQPAPEHIQLQIAAARLAEHLRQLDLDHHLDLLVQVAKVARLDGLDLGAAVRAADPRLEHPLAAALVCQPRAEHHPEGAAARDRALDQALPPLSSFT